MGLRRCGILLVAAALLARAHGSAVVSFVDSPDGNYLKGSGEVHFESIPDLSAVVTTLLNLAPLAAIDASTSKKVADLVKASPFDKPDAVAVINIAGASNGFQAPPAAQTFQNVGEREVLSAVIALSRAEGAEHTLLDIGSLPGCGELCLETMLQEALSDLGLDANYSMGTADLRGQLSMRVPAEKQPVAFDLQQVPDRLFAVELISTWRTALNAADDKRSRGGVRSQPQLIERTLVSLEAVGKAYGTDSPRFISAAYAVQKLLAVALKKLQDGFNGRVVAVVTSFKDQKTLDPALLGKRGEASFAARSLLQAAGGNTLQTTDSFIAWIVMWCIFFLLLFFGLAGCYCLKNMKFKQDSLLYGKNKSE